MSSGTKNPASVLCSPCAGSLCDHQERIVGSRLNLGLASAHRLARGQRSENRVGKCEHRIRFAADDEARYAKHARCLRGLADRIVFTPAFACEIIAEPGRIGVDFG